MNNSSKDSAYMWALFSLAVIYFALLSASVYEDGMTVFELFRLSADASLKDIRWTSYTLRFVFIFLLLYIGGIAMYYSSRHNRRPGIEHGSAKWGSVHELNRKYSDKDDSMNVILTQHLKMSMNGNVISAIVVLIFAICVLTVYAYAEVRTEVWPTILYDLPAPMTPTGYNVSVRSGPDTNYTIFGEINKGELIYVNSEQYYPWYWGVMDKEAGISKYYGTTVYGFVSSSYLGNVS